MCKQRQNLLIWAISNSIIPESRTLLHINCTNFQTNHGYKFKCSTMSFKHFRRKPFLFKQLSFPLQQSFSYFVVTAADILGLILLQNMKRPSIAHSYLLSLKFLLSCAIFHLNFCAIGQLLPV